MHLMRWVMLAVVAGALLAVGLLYAVNTAAAATGAAQPPAEGARVRIGVYDSRVVAVAWGRSGKVGEELSKLVAEAKAAQASGDQKRFEELNDQLVRRQFTMHAQGFAGYRPEEALIVLKTRLPEIAIKANVVAIVDRMEYRGGTVEMVDMTDQLCAQFEPTAETRRILEQMKKAPAVSLWDATHEEK